MKRYRARDGAPYSDAQAQVIGEELHAIAERSDGNLAAAAVVDAARPAANPLHGYFEWSDAKAAEHWRREQARSLIRAIEVQIEVRTPDGAARTWFRAFPALAVSSPESEQDEAQRRSSRYVSIETVVSQRRLVDQAVAEAERDLRSWARRYESYRRFAEFEPYGVIFDLVD